MRGFSANLTLQFAGFGNTNKYCSLPKPMRPHILAAMTCEICGYLSILNLLSGFSNLASAPFVILTYNFSYANAVRRVSGNQTCSRLRKPINFQFFNHWVHALKHGQKITVCREINRYILLGISAIRAKPSHHPSFVSAPCQHAAGTTISASRY